MQKENSNFDVISMRNVFLGVNRKNTEIYMCKSNLLFNLGGDFYDQIQVRSQEELNRKNTLLGSIYELQVGANPKRIRKTFWFNLVFPSYLCECEKFRKYCRFGDLQSTRPKIFCFSCFSERKLVKNFFLILSFNEGECNFVF